MSFIFIAAKTYSCDLELFKKLGLKPFKTNNQDELFVGEYELPDYERAKIKIFVTCTPAQFWRFEIETDENKKFEVLTGSGAMLEYWSSALKVAESRLVVKAV